MKSIILILSILIVLIMSSCSKEQVKPVKTITLDSTALKPAMKRIDTPFN